MVFTEKRPEIIIRYGDLFMSRNLFDSRGRVAVVSGRDLFRLALIFRTVGAVPHDRMTLQQNARGPGMRTNRDDDEKCF